MPGGVADAATAYKAAAKAGECYPLGQAKSPVASGGSPLCQGLFLGGSLSSNLLGFGEASSWALVSK